MSERIGQRLGNYIITQTLGRGGFAEVYLGEHVFLKTPVAIKMLHAHLTDDHDQEGFLKEAQTVARLVHPNIIRVTDFGIDAQIPYLVMDYAPNGTLRQRSPRGTRIPLPTIVAYVRQIAAALQYAHDEKLVHRDIKPENMLIGRRNEVMLGDFGIALVAQTSRATSTQDVVGTIAYMSPEQIQGKPRFASDQYSLGIVVYEWLCGILPFRGSFTELCTQHMFAIPPSLSERCPDLPPEVEQIVMIALAKDPKQRFGSIQAFARAFEQASQVSQGQSSPGWQPSQPMPQIQSSAGWQPSQPMPLILPDPNRAVQQAVSAEAPANTSETMNGPVSSTGQQASLPGNTSGSVRTTSEQVSLSGWSPPSSPGQPMISSPGISGAIPVQSGPVSSSGFSQPGFASTPYIPLSDYPATPHTRQTDRKERRPAGTGVWEFGSKQIAALIFSLAFTSLAGHITVQMPANVLFASMSAFLLALVFCSTAFGPWVGLLTGGLVGIIDAYIRYPGWILTTNGSLQQVPAFTGTVTMNWTVVALLAVTGLLIGTTGFHMFYKQGGISRLGAIILADLLGGLLLMGLSIARLTLRGVNGNNLSYYLNNAYFAELGITLGALSVLLLFYSAFVPRPKRSI